jgi:hypothetical protein
VQTTKQYTFHDPLERSIVENRANSNTNPTRPLPIFVIKQSWTRTKIIKKRGGALSCNSHCPWELMACWEGKDVIHEIWIEIERGIEREGEEDNTTNSETAFFHAKSFRGKVGKRVPFISKPVK